MIKRLQLNQCIVFALISFLLVNTMGCSRYQEDHIETELTNEVQSFYDDLLLRDLDSLMKKINPESESYYNLYKEFRSLFKEYKNSYVVKEITFLESSKKRAKVSSYVTVSGVHTDTEEHLSYDVIHDFIFILDSNGNWKINSFETEYNIQ